MGDQSYKKAINTVNEAEANVYDGYDQVKLSHAQLDRKATRYKQERDDIRMTNLNAAQKIKSQAQALSLHKQLLVLLGTKVVPRLRNPWHCAQREARTSRT